MRPELSPPWRGSKPSIWANHSVDSITVSRADEIGLYYEWSKWYFISTYYGGLKGCFKAKLFIAKYKRKNLSALYYSIDGRLNIIQVFKILLGRAINSIKGLPF